MAGETGKTKSRTLNKLQFDIANVADTITTAAGDFLLVADISDDYKVGKVALSSITTATLGSIGESIIPTTDDTIDLGDATHQWKDVYVDGVLYADAIDFNGTALTPTAAEINLLAGVTATTAELNYVDLATLGTGAASKAVVLDAGEDYVWPATGILTAGVVTVAGAFTASSTSAHTGAATFSGAILNAPITIANATPYTVLAANSGRVHIISEQTASITINLPVIAAGMYYKFVFGGVATETENWVFVATTPSFINAGVHWADLNSVASNTAVVYGNGTSHLTFTAVTPAAGSTVEFYSNGTEWILNALIVSDSTPTIA